MRSREVWGKGPGAVGPSGARARRPGAAGATPRVEVRRTRHGRELIVDDTFASFHPDKGPATGSVWDALVAPILLLPPSQRRRALVLGLGGGSAARLLRALAPGCAVVGVERDAEVLRVAREALDLDALGVEVVEDDAREVLRRERRRFDLVIDDVFVGSGDDVHKPPWLPDPALGHAARRLSPGGILVSNTLDESRTVEAFLRELFPHLIAVEVDGYDNRILAASEASLAARPLRRALAADPILRGTLRHLRLRTLAP